MHAGPTYHRAHGPTGWCAGAPQPPRRRDEPVPPPARPQPGRLVPVGPRGARARAVELDRPIFLSIGYAACHWCHVMERESFEDEATAAVLNERFVADQGGPRGAPGPGPAVHGRGPGDDRPGRLADVACSSTPDGSPFFGGTYFPDTPRHGMPSFRQVLEGVRRGVDRRSGPRSTRPAARLVEALAEQQGGAAGAAEAALPGPEVLAPGGRCGSRPQFDAAHGGWGRAPEVPPADDDRVPAAALRRVGRRAARSRSRRASLDAMAAGGIHDQLGGGFHRYATDARWLVPHFEQMLYDNAQLARVYAHAWALTGDRAYSGHRDGDARLPAARAADARRRVRREPGRGHRGRGGGDLRVVRGGAAGRARRGAAPIPRCSPPRTA